MYYNYTRKITKNEKFILELNEMDEERKDYNNGRLADTEFKPLS